MDTEQLEALKQNLLLARNSTNPAIEAARATFQSQVDELLARVRAAGLLPARPRARVARPEKTEKVAAPGGDVSAPPEVLVGVIGCGALGTIVVQMLLDAGFAPSQLLVSTRSPQKQRALVDQGVRVAFDNERVAGRCHLLIVAVLPAQLLHKGRMHEVARRKLDLQNLINLDDDFTKTRLLL
mgnify:CR=1 FL=1